MLCCGCQSPIPMMDGFLRRIWKSFGIDKIVVVNKGLFLVRCHNVVDRDKILNDGFNFFDNKPLIVKQWHAEMDFKKEELKTVSV